MIPPKKKGRGVASAFLGKRFEPKNADEETLPPARPPRAAADATAIDPLRRKHADERDDDLIQRTEAGMVRNGMLIPGENYDAARQRRSERSPVLSTMDEHGVQDVVNNLSQPPRNPMTDWNPADPYSADNPEVSKQLRAEELARKRKIR